MSAETENYTLMFLLLADLAIATGAAPINEHPDCWEIVLDGPPQLRISVNGHEEKRCDSQGVFVNPFHAYIEYNGWPWAIFSPHGGDRLGYEHNEDAAIEVLRNAITKAREVPA